MKRIALTLLLCVLVMPTQAHASSQKTCSYQGLRPGHWTHAEVHRTIRCAVRRYPVPGGVSLAFCVARHESGMNARAHSPTNDLGVYQHHAPYWPRRQRAYDKRRPPIRNIARSAFNARANVLVSVHMAHTSGWGPWAGDPCFG